MSVPARDGDARAPQPGTADSRDDSRSRALDAFLVERAADGYRVETRSPTQAVICRRHALYFVLRHIAPANAQTRLVVSVDDSGEVTSGEAEPLRW